MCDNVLYQIWKRGGSLTDDPNPLPQRSTGDYTHTAAKAALSLIPVAGGAAAELFSLVLAPPIERRRDGFMADLYRRLKQLEEKVAGFHLKDLQNNEAFVSAALQATRAAIGTNQQEKREYLQNALLNIAAGKSPDEIKQQMFLNAIEAFAPAHVRVLDLCWKGSGKRFDWDQFNVPLPLRTYAAAMQIVAPELKGQPGLCETVLIDLRNRGFSKLGTAEMPFPQSAQITNLGIEFLNFVLSPEDLGK
jgi:hypothetical protein